ncbi:PLASMODESMATA CALLOSE-BINDING PROTEIN 2-like [Punica granatum]|uniref:X8 domain-containing protein n=2 Tax=Punica granatum TaxID=22663 RepID=A0A218VXT8_PUNGR|nr:PLASMODESMATA CALLOSE-BINDING PROTEIN 2-like [Punica granatum]OWM65236.1 hypothetical protein CDL15_Pgr008826 [Punica granatum]PKI47747.1 hypothetical protein CRG98_031880 [Punica granatum]
MAFLAVAVLILAISGHSSAASWCVCKFGLSDTVLQKALDWACGNGADCNPIRQNGVCYQPDSVRTHCSYAVNSYFQKKGQTTGACDFGGAAAVSTTDPSANGCSYPSSATSSTGTGTPTTPATGTTTPPGTTTMAPPGTTTTAPPGTTTPITTTPTTSGTPSTTTTTTGTTPYGATPTGILGAGGTGVSPTGMNTDMSHGGLRLLGDNCFLAVSFLVFSSVVALMQQHLLY